MFIAANLFRKAPQPPGRLFMSAEKFIGVLAAIYHRPGGSTFFPSKLRPSGDSTHQTPREAPCLSQRLLPVGKL